MLVKTSNEHCPKIQAQVQWYPAGILNIVTHSGFRGSSLKVKINFIFQYLLYFTIEAI